MRLQATITPNTEPSPSSWGGQAVAGPQQPGHCCHGLFGGRSRPFRDQLDCFSRSLKMQANITVDRRWNRFLWRIVMQVSVFHVVLALSNMDERMQRKAGAGAVCQLHDTNHGRHLGRTCTPRSVRGFGSLVMHMSKVLTFRSHLWWCLTCYLSQSLHILYVARVAACVWVSGEKMAKDLCVGIVNSVTRSNREVKGLCSSPCKLDQAPGSPSWFLGSLKPVVWC